MLLCCSYNLKGFGFPVGVPKPSLLKMKLFFSAMDDITGRLGVGGLKI